MRKYSLITYSLIILLIIAGCSAKSNKTYIAEQLKIKMPKALNIEHADDHGGFHGDGKRFAKIEFDNNSGLNIISQIENSDRWNKMPLTENLSLIMYGGTKNNVEYVSEFAEKFGIPEIQNGYWYFNDRHSKSTNPESDTELFDRYSLNFTLSMYDADNNTLYFFELDT